jgi:uncharacterized protein (DUF111 family)
MTEKILYFDCSSGISGDMTLGALIDLGVDVEAVKTELRKLGIGNFDLVRRTKERSGIGGTDLDVIIYDEAPPQEHDDSEAQGRVHAHDEAAIHDHNHPRDHDHSHAEAAIRGRDHSHRTYTSIKTMIENSGISGNAKRMAIDIFTVIGKAEAAVHGEPLEKIAFHEVGAMDSILDIVGTAIAVDMLGVTSFLCSPIHDGHGQILCRHGLIPVPVPAVMEMLKASEIPVVLEKDVETELVTPTGFGILEGLGAVCAPEVCIKVERVGYGFGKKETGKFGAVRAILGTRRESEESVEQ